MRRHWLLPRLLAGKLARGEVSNTEVAYFMIGNLLLGSALYYSGVVWGNPPWTALSLWECALVVVVTVYGMIRCFDAAGGEANARFAADFNCLSFPIWLWTSVIVWSAFWIVTWLLRRWGLEVVPASSPFAETYAFVFGKAGWVLTAGAIVGSQIIFFAWMRATLAAAAAERMSRTQ